MRNRLASLVLLLGTAAQASPLNDAVAVAAADAQSLGIAASRVRYLVLTGKNAKDKEREWRTISGHLNATSRQPVLKAPTAIIAGGIPKSPEDAWHLARLLRVNLDDYSYSVKTWDELGFSSPYSVVLVETVLVTTDQTGRWFRFAADKSWTQERAWQGPTTRKILATAPWLAETPQAAANITNLVNLTQSRTPILPADNFVWQTAIQANRRVGYYGLLGIKNRNDFLKLTGINIKDSTDYSPEFFAGIAESGVAQQPRRVIRYRSYGGGVYLTQDNKLAVDEKNPLRFLNGGFKHEAEEWFGHGKNGLWVVGLFDDKGNRQDSAPDFIGYDHFAHSNDGKINVGLSCFRCHSNGGLQDIKNSVRNTYTFPQVLQGPVFKAIEDAKQHYFQRIEGYIKADREVHEEAMLEATGWKHEEWVKEYARYFAAYDKSVTITQAAEEVGMGEGEFLVKLEAYRNNVGLDPVLSMFTVEERRREAVPRFQWIEAYNLAQLAVRGLQQWPNQGR